MARRTPNASRPAPPSPAFPPQLAAANLHAAGLDVGAAAHGVAVPPSEAPQPVRGCDALTAALEARAAWLGACAITTVALAATGVSWLPLFALLEARGFEGLLVEPPQGQQRKGRPTRDVQDGQWMHRLHPFGLLARALRPADQVCGLRRALRPPAMRLPSAAHHSQPRQKALTPMHVTVQHVVSAIPGVTALAILRAILGGARAPDTHAPRRDDRCTPAAATSARAGHVARRAWVCVGPGRGPL